jgi:hypothetical protein
MRLGPARDRPYVAAGARCPARHRCAVICRRTYRRLHDLRILGWHDSHEHATRDFSFLRSAPFVPFPWHVSLKSAGLLDPFRHRSLARAFSLQDPRKIEPHEVHRGVLSVRSTLEQQVHGAFPGRAGSAGRQRRVRAVPRVDEALHGPGPAAVEARPERKLFAGSASGVGIAEDQDVAPRDGKSGEAASTGFTRKPSHVSPPSRLHASRRRLSSGPSGRASALL